MSAHLKNFLTNKGLCDKKETKSDIPLDMALISGVKGGEGLKQA